MPRRSPRTLALWGAAAVVAVATAAVVAGDLAALHRRAADLGPEVDAVVATRDLPVGHALANGDLATRTVHRSQLPSEVATDRADLVGRIVAVPVLDGAYLVRRNLGAASPQGTRRHHPRGDAGDAGGRDRRPDAAARRRGRRARDLRRVELRPRRRHRS